MGQESLRFWVVLGRFWGHFQKQRSEHFLFSPPQKMKCKYVCNAVHCRAGVGVTAVTAVTVGRLQGLKCHPGRPWWAWCSCAVPLPPRSAAKTQPACSGCCSGCRSATRASRCAQPSTAGRQCRLSAARCATWRSSTSAARSAAGGATQGSTALSYRRQRRRRRRPVPARRSTSPPAMTSLPTTSRRCRAASPPATTVATSAAARPAVTASYFFRRPAAPGIWPALTPPNRAASSRPTRRWPPDLLL